MIQSVRKYSAMYGLTLDSAEGWCPAQYSALTQVQSVLLQLRYLETGDNNNPDSTGTTCTTVSTAQYCEEYNAQGRKSIFAVVSPAAPIG